MDDPAGLTAAYAELQRIDPTAAERIEPGNVRRIARALEVIRITGRRFSSYGPGVLCGGDTVFPVRMAGVWLSRAVLGRRIEARVAQMRADGLVDEVHGLADTDSLSRTATQAIGYKEVMAHLDGSQPSLDDTFTTVTDRTRAFARRQRMWFRRDPRITWLAASDNPCAVVPSLLAWWAA